MYALLPLLMYILEFNNRSYFILVIESPGLSNVLMNKSISSSSYSPVRKVSEGTGISVLECQPMGTRWKLAARRTRFKHVNEETGQPICHSAGTNGMTARHQGGRIFKGRPFLMNLVIRCLRSIPLLVLVEDNTTSFAIARSEIHDNTHATRERPLTPASGEDVKSGW